jgi:hypothetical protein
MTAKLGEKDSTKTVIGQSSIEDIENEARRL